MSRTVAPSRAERVKALLLKIRKGGLSEVGSSHAFLFGSSRFHHLDMISAEWPGDGRLPIDLLPAIARQLVRSESLHTLSTLLSMSTNTHRRFSPLLYTHLSFPSDKQLRTFLQCLDPRQASGSTKQRRLDILQAAESLHLDEALHRDTVALILELVETLPCRRVFRNVKTLSLSEYALGELAKTAPSAWYGNMKGLVKRRQAWVRLAQPRLFKEVCRGDHRTEIPISYLMGFVKEVQNSWAELVEIRRVGPNIDSHLSLRFPPKEPVVLAFHLLKLPQARFPTGWSDTVVGAYLSSLTAKSGMPETYRPSEEDDANWSRDRRRAFITYIEFGLTTALERGSAMSTEKKSNQWKLEVVVKPG